MNFKKLWAGTCIFFLISIALAGPGTRMYNGSPQTKVETPESQIEFISAEDLKARIAKKQPVTILDVRSTEGSGSDERKIKGAIHVKLRRLRYRLGFPPLKETPRNQEVVTYCACPSDEASIRAAQMLMEAGFKRVRVLKGGWVTWKKMNGQMETAARGM